MSFAGHRESCRVVGRQPGRRPGTDSHTCGTPRRMGSRSTWPPSVRSLPPADRHRRPGRGFSSAPCPLGAPSPPMASARCSSCARAASAATITSCSSPAPQVGALASVLDRRETILEKIGFSTVFSGTVSRRPPSRTDTELLGHWLTGSVHWLPGVDLGGLHLMKLDGAPARHRRRVDGGDSRRRPAFDFACWASTGSARFGCASPARIRRQRRGVFMAFATSVMRPRSHSEAGAACCASGHSSRIVSTGRR